jgi:hypothetical protein
LAVLAGVGPLGDLDIELFTGVELLILPQ